MEQHQKDQRVRVKQSVNGVSIEVEGSFEDVSRYLGNSEGKDAAARFEVLKAPESRQDVELAHAQADAPKTWRRYLLKKGVPLADQLAGHSYDLRARDIAYYPWFEKFVLLSSWAAPMGAYESFEEAKAARDGVPVPTVEQAEAGAWADKPLPVAVEGSNLESWTPHPGAPKAVVPMAEPDANAGANAWLSKDNEIPPWDARHPDNANLAKPPKAPTLPPAPATPSPWAAQDLAKPLPRVEQVDEMRTVVMHDYDARPVRMEDAGLFTGLLALTGDDPKRGGLIETPDRMLKAFEHWFGGYKIDIAELLKVFEDGAEGVDQMVIVKDIPIYSKCEHHMADIFGTASIAYIPNGKIVGLSKLSRLADAFARRLQVQERLTNQIADALTTHLSPLGVGVVIKARHMCMESRGICQQGHHTITSALRGVIKEQASARAEFFSMVNSN